MEGYTFPSGATYSGYFKGNLRHGKGTWAHPNGEEYDGEYKDNKKHGLGVYSFKDTGKMYIGSWVNDKIEGKGLYYFDRGHTVSYFGEYANDRKHGSGFYTYESGVITSQVWDNGKLVKEVRLPPEELVPYTLNKRALINRVREEGKATHLLGDLSCGSEVRAFQFPSGATYTGQFSGTKKHGTGLWLHPEGDKYEGQFAFNKHHGWGVYTIGRSGKKYVGEWDAGQMSGVGVYFFNPEETEYFVGTYVKDVKHGQGMYHFHSQQKDKIQWWEEGTLVRDEDATPEQVASYLQTIESICNAVQPFAPEYEPKIDLSRVRNGTTSVELRAEDA